MPRTEPGSVTRVGSDAFVSCTSLTSVTIPDSVTEIGWYAFCNCTSLTDVYYTGTEARWKAIEIRYDNDPVVVRYYGDDFLLKAAIHYNCAPLDIKKGDVTGDGVVDNMDAAKILKYDAGLIGETDALLAAGDVTGDGVVDNMDAAKILKYDAGLISSL